MRLTTFLVIVPSYVPFVRVLEMQATLIELVDNFEFSPPPGNIEIIRAAATIMSPMSVSCGLLCPAHIPVHAGLKVHLRLK